MNLRNGLNDKQFDFSTYLGELRFLRLRREDMDTDEDGNVAGLKKRVYDFMSEGNGKVVSVSVPPNVPLREYDRGQLVKLISPTLHFMAEDGFPEPSVIRYLTANDIAPISEKPNQTGGQQSQGHKPNHAGTG